MCKSKRKENNKYTASKGGKEGVVKVELQLVKHDNRNQVTQLSLFMILAAEK